MTSEKSAESAFGYYVWPCAIRLAEWVYLNADEVKSKIVVELGCGVGLVGIAAAKCGASFVYFTDKKGNETSLRLSKNNVKRNSVDDSKVAFRSLSWDNPVVPEDISPDIILVSDGFYDPSVFDSLTWIISQLLHATPGSRCIFSYQLRCGDWSIANQLKSLGLRAVPIDIGVAGLAGPSFRITKRERSTSEPSSQSIIVGEILSLDST